MENWKPVKGYEEIYEVSDRGRVRSVDRRVNSGLKHSGYKTCGGRVLKQKLKSNGYKEVSLSKGNVVKSRMVHRLVADAFLDAVEGKPYVNHKNLNKGDNRVENLEWCSASENTKHALANGAFTDPVYLKNRRTIKCVETGGVFPSSYQAAEWVNQTLYQFSKDTASMSRKIRACATGKQTIAYTYHWIDV